MARHTIPDKGVQGRGGHRQDVIEGDPRLQRGDGLDRLDPGQLELRLDFIGRLENGAGIASLEVTRSVADSDTATCRSWGAAKGTRAAR